MIRALALVALAGTACSASWRATPPKSATVLETARPTIQASELSNGLRLVVSEAGSQLADVALVWQLWRLDAVPGQAGAAWLAPRLIATDQRWLAVTRQLGGHARFAGDRDGATIAATSLVTDVDALLNALSRMVREPRCDERSLSTLKRSSSEELGNSGPRRRANGALDRALFGEDNVYTPVSAADIAQVTCASVLELMKRCLVPGRLAVTVSGGVKASVVQRAVAGYFGQLDGPTPTFRSSGTPNERRVVLVDTAESGQTFIAMGRFVSRYPADTALNLATLRRNASFAEATLRQWDDIAYGVSISIDELAYGYDVRIMTTVPSARSGEALVRMLSALRGASRIHSANAPMLFSHRVTLLQTHMLRYQTVAGINNEFGEALVKGQPAQRTVTDLYALRDGDWGESILWANSRLDVDAMSIVLVGEPATTAAALQRAGLTPTVDGRRHQ